MPRGITMRGDKYRVRISFERRQYDLGQFDSLNVARAALEQARIEIIRHEFAPPAERRRRRDARLAAEAAKQTTVSEWAETWLDNLANDPERPRSPGTLASYRSNLRAHVLPTLGEKRLVDVTTADVDAMIAAARSAGPGVARNVVGTVRSMFNAAAAESVGGLVESPVKVRFVKNKARLRDDDEVPNVDELRTLAAAMPDELQLAVWLAALLGLRLGEVLGIQRHDFRNLDHPAEAEALVRRQWMSKANPPAYGPPKDDSHGVVSIPSAMVPMIERHLAAHVGPESDAPLFASVRDRTRPISHGAFGRRWNIAREGARYPFAFHALRHFALTTYSQGGATPTETQRRGRQRNPEAAARYQHSSRARDHQLAEHLNVLIEGE